MKLSKSDVSWCAEYAKAQGLDAVEVSKAVISFFDDMVYVTRKLPFNNIRRIYSAEAVSKLAPVFHLPSVGRLGPMYNQYKKWRKEQAGSYVMVSRKDAKRKHRQERIEEAARRALSGKRVSENFLYDSIPSDRYYKVWLIDAQGKRKAAWQLFKKENNN